jgi:apolipoprotein N-acyltransferase
VANTGSSALIDKYGRIVGDVPRYKEGFGIITI